MFQWTTEVTAHWNQLCKCASQTRIVYQTREESCARGNSLLGQLVYITLSTSKPILQEIHYFEEFLDRKKNVFRWKTCDVLNPHKWKTPYVLQNSPNHLRKKFMTNGKENECFNQITDMRKGCTNLAYSAWPTTTRESRLTEHPVPGKEKLKHSCTDNSFQSADTHFILKDQKYLISRPGKEN